MQIGLVYRTERWLSSLHAVCNEARMANAISDCSPKALSAYPMCRVDTRSSKKSALVSRRAYALLSMPRTPQTSIPAALALVVLVLDENRAVQCVRLHTGARAKKSDSIKYMRFSETRNFVAKLFARYFCPQTLRPNQPKKALSRNRWSQSPKKDLSFFDISVTGTQAGWQKEVRKNVWSRTRSRTVSLETAIGKKVARVSYKAAVF